MAYKALHKWVGLILIIATLSFIYQGSITKHIRKSVEPLCFNQDVRQWISPFFRYTDQSLFKDDYIVDYYIFTLSPLGFRSLYAGLAKLLEPAALSKVLPYGLLLITLLASALSTRRFGGMAAAWAAAALTLSTGLYLSLMSGGLPRSFALPLFACSTAAIIYGRTYLLAVLVISAAAFYPTMAVSAGIALAIVLLAMPVNDRGTAAEWSFKRRVGVLAATGLLSALLVFPLAWNSRAYGPLIRPSEVALYQEAGLGGRFSKEDLTLHTSFQEVLYNYARRPFIGAGEPWNETLNAWVKQRGSTGQSSHRQDAILLIIWAIIFIGMAWLILKESAARRLMVLTLAVFLAYGASRLFFPYLFLPNRHLKYSLPILATVMFPAAVSSLGGILESLTNIKWLKPASVLAVPVLALALIGGRGSTDAGLEVCIDKDHEIYNALSALPADSQVAGWPKGLLDNVPYLSKRSAFLKVTHLVVNKNHFTNNPPHYFKPFDDWVKKAHARGQENGFILLDQFSKASKIFEGSYTLLDLRKL
jgi:hypothetical protein